MPIGIAAQVCRLFSALTGKLCEVRVITTEGTMILVLGPRKYTQAQHAQPLPINIAGQALQFVLCLSANDTFGLTSSEQGTNQRGFLAAGSVGDSERVGAAVFQVQINPRNKEEIAGAGLNGAGAREEQVGQRVAYRTNTQFIAGVTLAKEFHHIEHCATFAFGVIQPGES